MSGSVNTHPQGESSGTPGTPAQRVEGSGEARPKEIHQQILLEFEHQRLTSKRTRQTKSKTQKAELERELREDEHWDY